MPIEPTVCAIMLTRDRPDYARRAVDCWRSQTYANKRLLIFDTSDDCEFFDSLKDEPNCIRLWTHRNQMTIGGLRNEAIRNVFLSSALNSDIILHFDDDDYSHPNRIAEQVALLQSSGADCVGYREMIFWNETICMIAVDPSKRGPDGEGALGTVMSVGQSYLYSNPDPSYCLGTSLCYWRRTWERNPFSERNGPNPRERGEDREFLRGVKSVGVRSCTCRHPTVCRDSECEPRMIARIHAGNAKHYEIASAGTSNSWRRAPEFDEYCRGVMA